MKATEEFLLYLQHHERTDHQYRFIRSSKSKQWQMELGFYEKKFFWNRGAFRKKLESMIRKVRIAKGKNPLRMIRPWDHNAEIFIKGRRWKRGDLEFREKSVV